MQLGVLILMATPVTRVATSFIIFVKQRDRLYACITITVLAILVYGMFGAR
jgi:uncharacterized membrane protein